MSTSKKSERGFLNFFDEIGWKSSYISFALGIIVILIAVGFFIFLTRQPAVKETSSIKTNAVSEQQEDKKTTEDSEEIYTVKRGNTLWAISEKFYKSGYNWVDIARVNNLNNPDLIHSGNKFIIPKVKPIIIDQKMSSDVVIEAKTSISGNTYTVVRGDNLWNIAVRAYGDGFKWVEIAMANNLKNPSLIHAGNIFTIPRQR